MVSRLTLSRVFTRDKVVNSDILNILGVQVLRTVAARALYLARGVRPDDRVRIPVGELLREGIVVLPGFLHRDEFEALCDECTTLGANVKARIVDMHGPNRLEKVRLKNCDRLLVPTVFRFLGDQRLTAIVRAVEQRPIDLVSASWLEHLIQGDRAADVDPQTFLHSDTFFNTHKAWLYLDNVGPEDAPLVYAKGSQRLTLRRLLHTYRHSCSPARSIEPSRRITTKEIQATGIRGTPVICERNSLVIANTSGYHARLPGSPGRMRSAIYIDLRANPFRCGVRAWLSRI